MALIPRPDRAVAGLVAAALLLTGCSAGSGSGAAGSGSGSGDAGPAASASPTSPGSDATDSAPSYRRYVSLGDSYSAGPLIPTSDLAGGCLRSDHNYPSLVARRLAVADFVDVTCSAATTKDLTGVQRTFGDARIPPQLRSVTADTDLVTLGIGGNDLGLFGTIITTCTGLRAGDPTGSPCARRLAERGPDLDRATRVISDRVAGALRAVRTRAPDADVVLVGYLRLVPDRGTCPALPLAAGDYAEGRRISRSLDRALQQAARRTGVTYVDMYQASRGHDICSRSPWVNGRVNDGARAAAYHPFAVGMRADAGAVLAALGATP